MRRRGLIVAPLLAAASPDPGPEPVTITVAVGQAFTLRAPPGTIFTRGMGDSVVAGTLSGPGFALTVDLGVHADPLDAPGNGTPPRMTAVTIDGKAGRFGVWSATRGDTSSRAGLHVPSVVPTPIGALRLTISGQVADQQAAARVEAMLRTIRFRPLP